MEFDDEDPKWQQSEILPFNKRTEEIKKKRKEKEDLKQAKLLEMRQMKENEEKKRKLKEKNEMAERQRKEKAAKDQEARKKEEEEQMNRLEGRMNVFFNGLQIQDTPFEFSLSGLDLGAARCRMMAQNIAYNTSLLSIHMVRKGILDVEGQDLARILHTNNTLRKIELEGNNLGVESAFAFGRALKVNKTLRFLDLESNQLTVDATNFKGVV